MRRLEAAGVCVFCPSTWPDPTSRSCTAPHIGRSCRTSSRTGAPRLHLCCSRTSTSTTWPTCRRRPRPDFWAALAWVRTTYGLTYYGLAARNGDCAFTGGTIRHVHVHVLQGDVDEPGPRAGPGQAELTPPARSTQISSTPAARSTSSPSSTAYGPAK